MCALGRTVIVFFQCSKHISCEFDRFRVDTHLYKLRDTPAGRVFYIYIYILSSGESGKVKLSQCNSVVFAIQLFFWCILQFPWQRKRELSLPAVTVTSPAARAAVVYRSVRMSTRLDPWGSCAVEIATRKSFSG